MLLWSQKQTPDMPVEHADELRRIGTTIQSDFVGRRSIGYPGRRLEADQLRISFRAHYRGFARKLDEWDAMATSLSEALTALSNKARQVAQDEQFLPNAANALDAAARFQALGDQQMAAVPVTDQPMPNMTTTIVYGALPIAELANPTAEEVATKKGQFQSLIESVGTWPEAHLVRRFRRQLDALAGKLAPEATRISMSHDLSVTSKCPICPRS